MTENFTIRTVVVLSVLIIMCSCNQAGGTSMSSDEPGITAIEPTGFSDGRYEVSYLCIKGKLYQAGYHQYSFENRTEAEKYLDEKGYEAIGNIAKCDPYTLPKTDYAATHLEAGTVLYYSEKEDEAAVMNEEQLKIEFFIQAQ